MDSAVCHVVIVGCGLGGLAAAIAIKRQGHEVTMLEQAVQLSETGAGIQIPPNSARILNSWGLLESIETHSIEPEALILRAHRDGAVLSDTKIVPAMREAYGVPWFLIHRADYFNVLAEEGKRLGVKIKLACAVTQMDCSNAPISVANTAGPDIIADIVIGADGLHSKCRGMIQESPEPQLVTKGFVHRIMITHDAIRDHSELVDLLGTSVTNTWTGPGAHVATYPLKGSNTHNFVFICDTLLDTLADMKNYFKNWDPRLLLILDIAQDVKQWPMTASTGNEPWLHPDGNFALLGDACHAMFPFLAQGAAQAVEDGAVLGTLLGNLRRKTDIRDRLLVYEELRRPRATRVRELSVESLQIFRMLECMDRKEGGEGYDGVESLSFSKIHDDWADLGFRDWLFGSDVVREAEGLRGRKKESTIL